MQKRTPGAPLSEAEREQRVKAAKERWRKWREAGAAGLGAAAGAAAGVQASRVLSERAKRQGEQKAAAATAKAEARVARHNRKGQSQSRKAAHDWPMAPYARAKGREARLLAQQLDQVEAKRPNETRAGRARSRPTFSPGEVELRAQLATGQIPTAPPGAAYNKLRRRLVELREVQDLADRWPDRVTADEMRGWRGKPLPFKVAAVARERALAAVPKTGRLREVAKPREGRPTAPSIQAKLNQLRGDLDLARSKRDRARTLVGRPPPEGAMMAGRDVARYPQATLRPLGERLWADYDTEVNGAQLRPGQRRWTRSWPTANDLTHMRQEIRDGLAARHLRFATIEEKKGRAASAAARAAGAVGAARWKARAPALALAGALGGAGLGYLLARRRPEPTEKSVNPDLLRKRARPPANAVVLARWAKGTRWKADAIAERLARAPRQVHAPLGRAEPPFVNGGVYPRSFKPLLVGPSATPDLYLRADLAKRPNHPKSRSVRTHEMAHLADIATQGLHPSANAARPGLRNPRRPAGPADRALDAAERAAVVGEVVGARHHSARRRDEALLPFMPRAGAGVRRARAEVRLRGLKEGVLAKSAPTETPQEREARRTERSLASRIAGMLLAWGKNPAQAGVPDMEAREGIEDAVRETFQRMGGVIMPPPPGGNLQAPFPARPQSELGFSFDARAMRVEEEARNYSYHLITGLSNDSREAVRTAITLGSLTGATIPEQARLIRQSVGLSPGQVGWVNSYRVQLQRLDPRALSRELRDARFDPTLRRAIETGTPLTPDQIERMTDAYARRTLAYRATTIARTEAIRATNTASIAQARAMLEADPTLDVEKEWITAGDERVRHAHQRLNGQKVRGLETPFLVQDDQGNQVQIRWPHDPLAPASMVIGCRCFAAYRLIRRTEAGGLIAQAV